MRAVPITIRLAQLADANVLARAERAITATPGFLVSTPAECTEERFAQKIAALAIADNGRYFVAESAGQIVGHGLLDPLPLQAVRHVVHLTLAIHRGWQRRGIGRVLLAELIAWARAAPAIEKIELNVRSSNVGAQALYVALGFTEVGRWTRRVKIGAGQYLDDVGMELFVS